MIEFLVRLGIVAIVVGAGFVSGQPSPMQVGVAAGVAIAWSALVDSLERSGHRAKWGAILCAVDSVVLAFLSAAANQSDKIGFVVLAPVLWAVRKYGTNPNNIAPIAATALLCAPLAFNVHSFSPSVLLSSVAVLGVGMMVGRPRVMLIKPDPASLMHEPPLHDNTTLAQPATQALVEDPNISEELRDSYRALKDHTQSLERRSRRDRGALHLHESIAVGREMPYASLAKAIYELGGSAFVSIFVVAPLERKLVSTAHFGSPPKSVVETDLNFDGKDEVKLQNLIENRLDAWEQAESIAFGGVLLRAHDKIVGLVILGDRNQEQLHAAQTRVEEVAGVVAQLVESTREKESQKRRLVEAETLYTVAAVSLGAETKTSIAARVLRELGPTFALDHLSVAALDGSGIVTLATEGNPCDLLTAMSFGYGPGIGGWQAVGAPELFVPDVLDDDRVPKQAALKRRVGSYAIVPIQFEDSPFGYISAATQRVGGIDKSIIETLRTIAAELAQAFARLEGAAVESTGLMTPKEFRVACNKCPGTLVHIDVLRRAELGENYGLPALDLAVRRFASRARARLPIGGALCRRDDGDYMFFLPEWDTDLSQRWANDLIASYSAVTISTPDGRLRIPMTMRARVAPLNPQPVATSRLDA